MDGFSKAGSGPEDELIFDPTWAEREPLELRVKHRRGIHVAFLHSANVPQDRWLSSDPRQDDEPRDGNHAGARCQLQWPGEARRDHGSTTFLNSQPKVRLAIASESARFRHWPST